MATHAHLIIPGNRGNIRVSAIEGVALYVPRSSYTDEVTGERAEAVLLIETRRCLHRFGMSVTQAQAVIAAHGLALETTREDDGDSEPERPLPPLPTRLRPLTPSARATAEVAP